jgi:neutral ceramidase
MPHQELKMFEFGISSVRITPKLGTKLIGQPRQLEAIDKYTDLFARSLYLSSKVENIIIISCDLLFLQKEDLDHLRREISNNTGVRFENILIHTTHTHAGPSVTSLFNEDNVDPEVSINIFNGVIEAGVSSFKNKRRGFISFGRNYRNDLAFNRRYIMRDGSVELHPYKDDPNLLEAEGPNDPEINVLVLNNSDKIPVGALANFSCHLTSLERDNKKYSADFPAFAEKNLREALGNENFTLLYLNGPCGNICPVNVESKDTVEVGIEHTKKMGKKFSDSVMEIIKSRVKLEEDISIKTIYREIKIPIRNISEEMRREAESTVKQFERKNLKPKNVSNYGMESYKDTSVISANQLLETDFWKNTAAAELLGLYDRYRYDNNETLPLSVVSFGDIFIATVPAELFVEYSLELKKRFKDKYRGIFVAELVNGWVGYVPTKKAFKPKVGGYEVQFLNSSKLCEDAGEIIVKEIIGMEEELNKK